MSAPESLVVLVGTLAGVDLSEWRGEIESLLARGMSPETAGMSIRLRALQGSPSVGPKED